MSADFMERIRSQAEIKKSLQEKRDLTESVKLLWAERFNLPPNDGRLLSLSIREAIEQVNGIAAIREHIADHTKRPRSFDDQRVEVREREGDEAKAVADVPHLTGDPEWDAIELEETDPTRPPLKVAR